MFAAKRPSWWFSRSAAVAGLLLALVAATACGTEAEVETPAEPSVQGPVASDRVYTIEDLLASGFKKDKQYDVEELPGGIDAWLGYWGPDPYNRTQYELRFYPSHDDAVEHGPAPAEEVTGEDAELHRDNPTWKEGAKDRWRSSSVVGLTRGLQSGRLGPRYLGFVVFANMVVLSEGQDNAESLARCGLFVDALLAADEP